ncbi:hypothetical protein BG011_005073 [Mortierella polycephala]|uniref:Uncharacterized protein n=1 Tax=Mortierella polycephala TaxID=41804 RepID=A0A9P6Q017_9FUNG|nr:hypothetical protein BG011_005073 [Mortierella polycephala]
MKYEDLGSQQLDSSAFASAWRVKVQEEDVADQEETTTKTKEIDKNCDGDKDRKHTSHRIVSGIKDLKSTPTIFYVPQQDECARNGARTYTYYNPKPERSAQFIQALPQYLADKQRALDQYRRWDPAKGELAWGYHSVKPLIDAAYFDEHVYMDMLDNDPTNPGTWLDRLDIDNNVDSWQGENGQDDEARRRKKDIDTNLHRKGAKNIHRAIIVTITTNMSTRATMRRRMNKLEQHQDHNRPLSAQSTVSSSTSTVEDGGIWEAEESRMQDTILKAFDEATKRPEGQDYGSRIRREQERGSPPVVLGLVTDDLVD